MFRIRKARSGAGDGKHSDQRQGKRREVAHSVAYLGHTLMDNVRSARDITHERMRGNHAGFTVRMQNDYPDSTNVMSDLRLLAGSHDLFLVQAAHAPGRAATGSTRRTYTLGRSEEKHLDQTDNEVMHLQLSRVVAVHTIDCHLYIVEAAEAAVRRHSSHPNLCWRQGSAGEETDSARTYKSYTAPRSVFYCHCLVFQSPSKAAKVKRAIHKYQNKLAKEQARTYRKNRKRAERQRATAGVRRTLSLRRVFRSSGAATLTHLPSSSPKDPSSAPSASAAAAATTTTTTTTAAAAAGAGGGGEGPTTHGTAARVPKPTRRLRARGLATPATGNLDHRPRAFTTSITPPPSAPRQTRAAVPMAGMPLPPRPQSSPSATMTASTPERPSRGPRPRSCAMPEQPYLAAEQATGAHYETATNTRSSNTSSGISSSSRSFGDSTNGSGSKRGRDADRCGRALANDTSPAELEGEGDGDEDEELLYDSLTMIGISTPTRRRSNNNASPTHDSNHDEACDGVSRRSGGDRACRPRPMSTPPDSAFPLYNVPVVQSLPGSAVSFAALMSSGQSSGVSSRALSRQPSTDRASGGRSRTPVSSHDAYLQPQQLQAKINAYKQQRQQQQDEQQQQHLQQQRVQQQKLAKWRQQQERLRSRQQQQQQQQGAAQPKQTRRCRVIAEQQEVDASDTDSLEFGFDNTCFPSSPTATLPPKPRARQEAQQQQQQQQQPQEMRARAATVAGNERRSAPSASSPMSLSSRPLPPLPTPPSPPPRRSSVSTGVAAHAPPASLQSLPLPPPPLPAPRTAGQGRQTRGHGDSSVPTAPAGPAGGRTGNSRQTADRASRGGGQQTGGAVKAAGAAQHRNQQRVAASGEPSWYLGAVSSGTASKVLGNAPVGAFVVHVRAARRGYEYVMSVKAANKKVEQATFIRGRDGSFKLPDGRLSAHTLAGFAFAAMKSKRPLPGTTTPLVAPR